MIRTAQARVWFSWLSLGWLVLAAGCSSFDHAWKTAGLAGGEPASMAGRWEGTWRSARTGHKNLLRCLIQSETNGVCQARFHARYARWGLRLSFGYTVPLQLQATTNGLYRFQGQADLGWYAGGSYRYDGEASRTNFFSIYHNRYDDGEFQLHRPLSQE